MSRHFLHELRGGFATRSGRPALIHRGRTFTYGELDARARRCAAGLQGLGVGPGERVALLIPDKFPFLIAHLGALYSGAGSLPLNPRFTREELRYFLSDSEARVVICGTAEQPLVEELAAEMPTPPIVMVDQAALDPPAGGASFREPSVAADDLSLILYSSGTTGWPKGVVHSQANATASLRALESCWRMNADDVVVNVLPLFHIHGLAFATHLTWLSGGCIWIEDAFDVESTMAAIARATVFMAVPPLYYRLLDDPAFRPAAASWTNIRLFTCGSAPIRPEVLPELTGILSRPVINRYGMTESYVITSLPLDGPWPAGSVGLPLPGIERQVLNADGSPTAPGEVGAVVVRGPNLFQRYWRKPEATQAAFASGWFDTGDLGSLDDSGFLTLVGRKHDLIITSGYNVYPQVVERVVGECAGVRECAVLGIPDRDRGERVAAAIVRDDEQLDEERVLAWCRDRLIYYQRPRVILFVDSLPRNSLGKVLRRELRERLGDHPAS